MIITFHDAMTNTNIISGIKMNVIIIITSSCICLDKSSSCCLAFSKLFLSTWSCGVWARSSWRVIIYLGTCNFIIYLIEPFKLLSWYKLCLNFKLLNANLRWRVSEGFDKSLINCSKNKITKTNVPWLSNNQRRIF